MYCTRKVADDLIWVGADDRRLAMFEGVYSVPRGVSYNSYLLLDEKTVVFDTVDHAVEKTWIKRKNFRLSCSTAHGTGPFRNNPYSVDAISGSRSGMQ